MAAKTSDRNARNWYNQYIPPRLVQNAKEKKLLDIKLPGSEKYPALREKYFSKLRNSLVKNYTEEEKSKQPDIVFTHLQSSSSIRYILPELMSFITSELKTIVELKPAVILKALYCLFQNNDVLIEENVSFIILCTSSLKKFLADSLKCCILGYLFKDIGTDILCELGYILSDTSIKLSCSFHYLEDEDVYGTTIAWLSSMTPEAGSRLIHLEALYSRKFLGRARNFQKMYARLVSLCEYHVYCCLPNQIVDVSVNQTHSLYNLKLVNQIFYNLMRHEVVYTPIFYRRYEQRISKPFQFSNLLFEVDLRELLESSPSERRERDMPDDSCRPPPKKKLKKSPKNFYASQTFSLYRGCESIWRHWDVFSGIRAFTDFQLVFFGSLSPLPNRMFDIYRWERAGIRHLSAFQTPNPFDMKLQGQDSYNPFMC